jgi:dephospho-CoA kinase
MENKKTIIGVTGTLASGKDTVADYISKKYDLKNYSTSDEVRYEATKRGVDHARASLVQVANSIRSEMGLGELARRALERVSESEKVALITGIRNVGEIKYLKENSNFYLISVDGPIEVRYERAKNRKRIGDGTTFEDFRNSEETELSNKEVGEHGIELLPCMRMGDFFIINDSTVEDLNMRVDEVVKAILSSQQI